MKSQSFYAQHFDSIQLLRGIAAIFVVLEHIRFLNCGAFGVDIFFCISGFMIMFTTQESTDFFLRKRLIRILPFYYIMTAGTFLLLLLFPGMFEQTTANPAFLIKSLLFIPFDIGAGVLQPLLRIGWTINCEIFFYLLFWIAFHISHRFRGPICALLLGSVVLAARLLPVSFAPLTFYGNPVMLEFAFGMLAFWIARHLYQLKQDGQLPAALFPAALIAAAVVSAGLLITKPYVNILDFGRLFYWGIPGMLLVLCFFLMGLFRKMPSLGVMTGNISFSLYLVHYYPVMLLDRMLFDFSSCTPLSVAGVLVCLPLCILLGYISWYLVEKQFTGYLRRKLLQPHSPLHR